MNCWTARRPSSAIHSSSSCVAHLGAPPFLPADPALGEQVLGEQPGLDRLGQLDLGDRVEQGGAGDLVEVQTDAVPTLDLPLVRSSCCHVQNLSLRWVRQTFVAHESTTSGPRCAIPAVSSSYLLRRRRKRESCRILAISANFQADLDLGPLDVAEPHPVEHPGVAERTVPPGVVAAAHTAVAGGHLGLQQHLLRRSSRWPAAGRPTWPARRRGRGCR